MVCDFGLARVVDDEESISPFDHLKPTLEARLSLAALTFTYHHKLLIHTPHPTLQPL